MIFRQLEKQYCDCKNELTFEKVIEQLDSYKDNEKNIILLCCSYTCDKCSEEYEINEEFEVINYER